MVGLAYKGGGGETMLEYLKRSINTDFFKNQKLLFEVCDRIFV